MEEIQHVKTKTISLCGITFHLSELKRYFWKKQKNKKKTTRQSVSQSVRVENNLFWWAETAYIRASLARKLKSITEVIMQLDLKAGIHARQEEALQPQSSVYLHWEVFEQVLIRLYCSPFFST